MSEVATMIDLEPRYLMLTAANSNMMSFSEASGAQ